LLHADFPSDDWSHYPDFDQEELETCLWSRRHFSKRSDHSVTGIDYLVHGHNSTGNVVNGESEAVQMGNRLYIEPGAYKGARFVLLAV
jgi:hypothetical protein